MTLFNIDGLQETQQTLADGDVLVVTGTGTISTAGTAISSTISNTNTSVHITVLGSVLAASGQGIAHNNGSVEIVVGADGYVGSMGQFGISTNVHTSALVTNYGSIYGDAAGVDLDAKDAAAEIRLVNYGAITGQNYGAILDGGNGDVYVYNLGTITGQSTGILIDDAGAIGVATIRNAGTIMGGTNAFVGGPGVDIVVNTGAMFGDVVLGDGNDVFRNIGGRVDGNVEGGAGDDNYVVDAHLDLVEAAAGGTDTVFARVNWALGDNFENLTLRGSDDLRGVGNERANEITGNGGDNRLFGQEGNDTIAGGRGDDLIRGGTGADTISGGGGEDRIYGGAGTDALTGDGGADMFVFAHKSDSLRKIANADHITDFATGQDQLDLSDLAGPKLRLHIGGGFVSGHASVRTVVNGDDTHVLIDVDGNGTADMRIILDGVTSLTERDFIL